ncbi:hypothetical protein TL16_g08912 [Triparma laevis f. inornata]|uniref:Uncharacterized protein n=2 Tax=Triparma laevis TaxID=1534972 RepID=A0A9W7FKJ0_9STRA|nr:hypothetical protein TL16_g08912 [Triparma laevis f. inornata]GMI13688.1 hypothetical protein TrLO_g3305 [Triparma laevis f. longispina]
MERLKSIQLQEQDQTNKRYNVFSLHWHKLLPFMSAILLAALPTTVRKIRDESTLMDSTRSGADTAVDVSLILLITISILLMSLGMLKDEKDELEFFRRLVRLLLESIQPEDEPRELDRLIMEEEIQFKLDTLPAIEGFTALYKFTSSYVLFRTKFHLAAFGMLSTVCVASVVVIFIASVFDSEIDVWNSYLCAFSILVWPLVLIILFNIVKTNELLTVRLKQYLRHQRRMNEKTARGMDVEGQLSVEDRAQLKRASGEIDALVEEIEDTHKTIRFLGKLPLNKSNMLKVAGAMAAGIFTTIMRSAIKLE